MTTTSTTKFKAYAAFYGREPITVLAGPELNDDGDKISLVSYDWFDNQLGYIRTDKIRQTDTSR